METVLGLVGVAALLAYVAVALRYPGGWADRAGRAAYVLANVVLVLLLWADWGRGAVEVTPLQLVVDGQWPVALPAVVAVVQLVLLVAYGFDAVWLCFALAGLGFVSFIPALVWIEDRLFDQGLLLSFLTPAPVIGLVLSAAAPLFVAPAVAHKIPQRGTRLWNVAFGKRRGLLDGIRAAADRLGLEYGSPRSILEAGSAEGVSGGTRIAIDTPPCLWPFAYTVRISVAPHTSLERARTVLQAAGLLPAEACLRVVGHRLVYEYRHATAIPLDGGAIATVVDALSPAVDPTAPAASPPSTPRCRSHPDPGT